MRMLPEAKGRSGGQLLPVAVASAVACLAPWSGEAAPSAETFYEALSAALASSRELTAQREQLRAASAGVSGARAQWLPTLAVTGDGGLQHEKDHYNGPFFPSETGTLHATDLNVSLVQHLYRGGQTLAETTMARTVVAEESAHLLAVEQLVLSKAAKSYLDVFADTQIEELRRRGVEALREVQGQVTLQYASGQTTRTDILQTETRLAGSKAEFRAASQRLENARAEYALRVGHEPKTLAAPPEVPELPTSLASALDVSARVNPDLNAAKSETAQAASKVDDLRAQTRPTVDLKLSYEVKNHPFLVTPLSITPTRLSDVSAFVSLSVPLFQPDSSAHLAGARHTLKALELTAEQVAAETTTKVTQAWASLSAARDRRQELEHIVGTSQQVLEGVKAERLAGARTVVDVLNAERDLLEASVSLAEATRDEQSGQVDLAVAIGIFLLSNIKASS